MATATRPRRDVSRGTPRREAKNPTTPRKGDKGVPDDLERRYRAGEQNAGSTSVGAEVDQSYSEGYAAGKKAPRGGTQFSPGRAPRPLDKAGNVVKPPSSPRPASPITFRRGSVAVPSVAAPMAVELALITADEFIDRHRLPLPSRLLVVFGIFGVLGLAKGDAAPAASALAWALVVATFYAHTTTAPPAGLQALATVGNFIGGKYAKGVPATKGATGG